MDKQEFANTIIEAIDSLPEQGKKAMENVAFFLEPEVRGAKANEVGIKKGNVLLGLYEGVPKTKRGPGYFGFLPDKITIFQNPIEMVANGDPEKIRKEIFEVVYHEVGHHLGFDEEGIREKELLKKKDKKHKH